MSISYEEALSTLEGMFGEKWTRDQLDAILRHKQGHMENTVEMILSHGERDPTILVDQINRGEDPNAARIDADEELARSLANGNRAASGAARPTQLAGAGPPPASRKGQRGTPTNLPPDFLRTSTQNTAVPDNQMESDEALARMLQDKMFSEELSRNPDFAHLANNRNSQRIRTSFATASNRGRSSQSQQQQQQQQPDIDIMKSLGELGNNARRRLQMMAAQFNAKTSGRGGAGAPNGTATSASAGGIAPGERRGLLDGEDNEDDVALEFATRKDL